MYSLALLSPDGLQRAVQKVSDALTEVDQALALSPNPGQAAPPREFRLAQDCLISALRELRAVFDALEIPLHLLAANEAPLPYSAAIHRIRTGLNGAMLADLVQENPAHFHVLVALGYADLLASLAQVGVEIPRDLAV